MFSILKKELLQFFGSWTSYIIASIFVLICSLFLWFFENQFNFFVIGVASMQSFFNLAPWVLLFLIPALTMKSIAEEQHQGTLVWLFSQPISLFSIVIGKFIALVIVVLFCLLPTFIYYYSMKNLSLDINSIDSNTIFTGYLGLIMLSIAFIALGLFTSSLSNNQVLAYISGVFLCLFAYFGLEALASFDLLGSADFIIQKTGFIFHCKSFAKGIVDTKDLCYFLFVSLLFIQGSLYFIKKKK